MQYSNQRNSQSDERHVIASFHKQNHVTSHIFYKNSILHSFCSILTIHATNRFKFQPDPPLH